MATKKKTAAKGVGDSTPTIIRNYDLQSMDKRLRNMEGDTVIPRNYDIYSMEERIHQLEVNGGVSPTPSEPVFITNISGGETSYTATKDMRLYISTGLSITEANFPFKVNNVSVVSEVVSNALYTSTNLNMSYYDLFEGDTFSCVPTLTNRYYIAMGV